MLPGEKFLQYWNMLFILRILAYGMDGDKDATPAPFHARRRDLSDYSAEIIFL